MFWRHFLWLMLIVLAGAAGADPNVPPERVIRGEVETLTLTSKALAENKIGLNPERQIRIYLPPSYRSGQRHFPTLYYIPHGEQLLDDGQFVTLLESTFKRGDLGELILVTGNFETPGSINFFGNGTTTGRWLDYITDELVPAIDTRYRTLAKPESRGISGHFLGGYAALKVAMLHPDLFGSVYALHPVATDTGERSMLYLPDWREIHAARNFSDLRMPYSAPFVAMAQAHLSNPHNPPFYADFIVELVEGELVPNQAAIRRLLTTFHLAELVPNYASNLKQLRGIGYDWGRNDVNQGHVYGARKLTTVLQDYGLNPVAVEHGGDGWDYRFDATGHIGMRMLPFFAQHLIDK